MFFNPPLVTPKNVNYILKGLAEMPAKKKDLGLVQDMRSFLVLDPGQRMGLSDLLAFNLARGRDHGLNTVNEIRKAYGLEEVASFQ